MKHKKRSPGFPLQQDPSDYCQVGNKLKRKYPTQLDAELSAPDPNLQQYICEYCYAWHNGKGKQPGSDSVEK